MADGEPKITVRDIPQSQYEQNIAASKGGGVSGLFAKFTQDWRQNWLLFTVAIVIILGILWYIWKNGIGPGGGQVQLGSSYDLTGFAVPPSGLYGPQLQEDYSGLASGQSWQVSAGNSPGTSYSQQLAHPMNWSGPTSYYMSTP